LLCPFWETLYRQGVAFTIEKTDPPLIHCKAMSKKQMLIDGVPCELIFRKSRVVNGKKIVYKKPFPMWVPIER